MQRWNTPILALVILAEATSSASADWQKTRWGMSEAQVIRVYPDARATDAVERAGRSAGSETATLKMVYASGVQRFMAYFRFRAGKLSSIDLCRPGAVGDLVYQLRLKYGEPISSDRVGWIWNTPADRISLTELDIVELTYSPRISEENRGL